MGEGWGEGEEFGGARQMPLSLSLSHTGRENLSIGGVAPWGSLNPCVENRRDIADAGRIAIRVY